MDIQLADVTLHIDQSLNTEELEKLEIAIRKKEGVISVHIDTKKNHLAVVEYNPEMVHSGELLEILHYQGLSGKLIGL